MKSIIRICISLFWLVFSVSLAADEPTIEINSLTTCPAADETDPDIVFQNSACKEQSVRDIDLVSKSVWARAYFQFEKKSVVQGLYISGSASSAVYLNGDFVGQNGRPGESPEAEIPGKMDSVIYLPPHLLKNGENNLTVYLSSYNGFLNIRRPLHRIYIGVFSDPTDNILRRYLPSLLSFGVFLVGCLYFGGMAIRGYDRTGSLLLSLMSFFAMSQLMAEVWRGITSYAYPAHEVRLLLILLFAVGFGLCVTAYIYYRLNVPNWKKLCALIGVVSIIFVAAIPGYDPKTISAILTPMLLSAAYLLFLWSRKQQAGVIYLAVLITFLALIAFSPGKFLDISFYYILAALLSFLFIQQAKLFADERKLRLEEGVRAQALAEALSRAQKDATAGKISITNKGKLELVVIDQLIYGRGAGDYVELYFNSDDDYKLYSGSIGQIERNLPLNFVRVHRSYIVNTAYVKALVSSEKGGGILELEGNIQIPVSRRIMPKVRSTLEASFKSD